MSEALPDRLRAAIESFKAWAETAEEDGRRDEVYPTWSDLRRTVRKVVRELPVTGWTDEVKQDLLYALARDYGSERLAHDLADVPGALFALGREAANAADWEARCQIAYALGKVDAEGGEAERLLEELAKDGDSFVRQRARAALTRRRSRK
jgi:hypothetical protein